MTTYAHEIAISAVPYDTMLVGELSERLAVRLRSAPHQRLWRHDSATQSDHAALSERLRQRPESVRVVTLDESPIPEPFASIHRCDFAADGLDGVARFALDAVVTSGGVLRPSQPEPPLPAELQRGWSNAPQPYLTQLRAAASLRRELDALTTELEPRLQGGLGTVADGRLLVMQWGGIDAHMRGVAALKFGSVILERVYRPESTGPDDWRWRTDEANGRACSTANLVAEWYSGASASMAT